jgi:hypothetical protein
VGAERSNLVAVELKRLDNRQILVVSRASSQVSSGGLPRDINSGGVTNLLGSARENLDWPLEIV